MKTITALLLGLSSIAILAGCTTFEQRDTASHGARATTVQASDGSPNNSSFVSASILSR